MGGRAGSGPLGSSLLVCKVLSRCKRGSQVWKSREQPFQERKLLKINASHVYQILEDSQRQDSGCWGKVQE